MSDFVQRLKERKLVQWSLAYLAGGWLVLQVLDVTAEPWGLSNGLIRTIQAALVFGFFVTLVLAWYHGERGQQGVSRSELMMLGGLLAVSAVILMVYQRADAGRSGLSGDGDPPLVEAAGAAFGPAVAVLPFVNNSPDEENAFFAAGIQEDILTQLSKIRDLTVLSRTSVMRYQDDSDRNLREIGEELGATAILEGSVRRDADRIRVTAQLNDAQADESMWAETYDRQLEDVFAVQSEIAREVADALQATLSPTEMDRISSAPTGSLPAYDLYLRGREAYLRQNPSDNEEAIRLYKQALALDSEYALALAGLSRAYANRPYRFGGDPAWADSALVLADRALEIDPREGTAHNARGYVFGTRGWRQEAYEEYLRAWELDPNDNTAMNNLAASHRARGQLDQALIWWERALHIDPFNPLYPDRMAFIHAAIGDTVQAVRLKRESLASLNPGGSNARAIEASVAVLEGDLSRAREIWEELLELEPSSPSFREEVAEAAFKAGDFDAVIVHLEGTSSDSSLLFEEIGGNASQPRTMLLYGVSMIEVGREPEGRDFLTSLIALRMRQIAAGNEDPPPWLDLATAQAALGQIDEALESFAQAQQIGGAFVAGLLGPEDGWGTALELTSLRSDPRFQDLMGRLEGDVADARALIQADSRPAAQL